MTKKQLAELKKRLKKKAFLAALAGGVYQLLQKYGYAPDAGTYQLWVDVVTYAALGWGVYATFDDEPTK